MSPDTIGDVGGSGPPGWVVVPVSVSELVQLPELVSVARALAAQVAHRQPQSVALLMQAKHVESSPWSQLARLDLALAVAAAQAL